MFKRKQPCPPSVVTDTVIERLIDLGVEYKQVAGYVWRGEHGESSEGDRALEVLVMRILNEEFQSRWAHEMLIGPIEKLIAAAYPPS